jgi:hypothetical protein
VTNSPQVKDEGDTLAVSSTYTSLLAQEHEDEFEHAKKSSPGFDRR